MSADLLPITEHLDQNSARAQLQALKEQGTAVFKNIEEINMLIGGLGHYPKRLREERHQALKAQHGALVVQYKAIKKQFDELRSTHFPRPS